MSKKKLNEYVITYAIFAHHRFKSIVVSGETKAAVENQFYSLHSRNEYRIKTVSKLNSIDFEPTKDSDDILVELGIKRCLGAEA